MLIVIALTKRRDAWATGPAHGLLTCDLIIPLVEVVDFLKRVSSGEHGIYDPPVDAKSQIFAPQLVAIAKVLVGR